MAEDEKKSSLSSLQNGSSTQSTVTMMAENKNTGAADDSVSMSTPQASGVSSFQFRQHYISPSGLHLANNTVVLPVQGLSSQTAISQGNVQMSKANVPLLGTNAVSGQLTFQTPVSHTTFQQAFPISQSVPVTSAVVGQPMTLQRGQQVTLQRGQQVTLQRFQANKGQPIAVQRFPAVLPASIQHVQRGVAPVNVGKVQLSRQIVTQANSNLLLSTKSSISPVIGTNQSISSNLLIPSPSSQQMTVQRIINPVVAHQNSSVVSPGSVNQSMTVNLHNTPPIGTATILPGQQITIQPRPAGTLIAGPVSSSITLTVTSVSPTPAVLSSTSSTAPVIVHSTTSQAQPFIQRPGVVISQPSVIRAGIPVVLPRTALALAGRQQVLQGTIQRLIQRPLLAQSGTCGGQVTVQIPHIVGPLIKMPNFRPSLTATSLVSSSEENSFQKTSSPVSTHIVSSTTTTTATVIANTSTVTQPSQAGMTIISSAFPKATETKSIQSTTTPLVTSAISVPMECRSVTLISESERRLHNGHAPALCTTSTSIQPKKENSVTVLDAERKEEKNEEIIDGGYKSNISSEYKERSKIIILPAPSESSKEKDTTSSFEASNITVLPNSLSSLRHKKTSTLPFPNKDDVSKEESSVNMGMILPEGLIDSLDWNGKVGTLPGSDMKFKINEFGDLELVEEADNVTFVVKSEAMEEDEDEDRMIEDEEEDDDDENGEQDVAAVNDPAELSEREDDPICCCVYCGRYGYKSNFHSSGRFCSHTCAGKKNMHSKQLMMTQMLNGTKKKKKKVMAIGEDNLISLIDDPNSTDRSPNTFDWDKYLSETGASGAPKRLFKEPFPGTRNGFKLGMRLEGVDPKHQALICVLSIAETQGFRLRLHFDGYSECYDFWVNADSPFIFPVGWAEKNGKTLQPPKNIPISEFNWTSYLKQTRAVAAPKHLFLNQPSSVTPSAFRVCMKLEATDQKSSDLFCVASVADTMGDKVLIHFDGWDDIYDFWCDINSPNIHPIYWSYQKQKKLSAPPDYGDSDNFNWDHYLVDTKSTAVPSRAFKPRSPIGFEAGMKLEVTDKRNPILIRVATVKKVKGIHLLVHFDGWGNEYDYWIEDDSSDLHPPQWCAKTFHSLQAPIDKKLLQQEDNTGGCPTLGCKGIGHIKGAKYTGHHSDFGCPYSAINMTKDTCLADRLGSSRSEEGGLVLIRHDYHGDIRRCPTQGCNGAGHVTGKFTSHHCVSGCPLAEKNLQKAKQEAGAEARPVGRPARGRKRKIFGLGSFGPHDKHIKTDNMDSPSDESSLFLASIHESVFQSMSGYPMVREQPLRWSDHTKLLPGVFSVDSSNVENWNIDQVAEFIQTLTGKEEQAQRFKDEEIDGDSFLLLQQSDLVNFLNIKLGPAVKIFNSIQVLKAGYESL